MRKPNTLHYQFCHLQWVMEQGYWTGDGHRQCYENAALSSASSSFPSTVCVPRQCPPLVFHATSKMIHNSYGTVCPLKVFCTKARVYFLNSSVSVPLKGWWAIPRPSLYRTFTMNKVHGCSRCGVKSKNVSIASIAGYQHWPDHEGWNKGGWV